MIGLGFGVFFVGYTLLTYGFSQLRGCNAGFISLVYPGPKGFQGCNPDPPKTSTNPPPTNPNISASGQPATGTNPLQVNPNGGPPIDYNKGSGGGVI